MGDAVATNDQATSCTVLGREVTFPVVVRDASNGTAIFLVSSAAAQNLLPGESFAVVECAPGQTQLAVGFVDYRDNDLGDYNEAMIVFFVRPAGVPNAPEGTFIYALPVDQEFTCAAGRRIWGFPKSVERVDVDLGEASATCRLVMQGRLVFELTLPTGTAGEDTGTMEMVTYSYLEPSGQAAATRFTQAGATGFGDPAAVRLVLGDHPIGRALAGLGLPSTPMLTTWTPRMRGAFFAPQSLG